MKKLSFMLLLTPFLIVNGCKKKDDAQPAPSPAPGPTDTYHPAPADGGFYVFVENNNNSLLSWTKNFTDIKQFSSKIGPVASFGLGKDTIVAFGNSTIYFGNIYNPSDMKSITCSRYVQYLSCINNVIVCYAADGNNHYLGYCDYKNGERDVTFKFLTYGEQINGPIQHTGTELIAGGYNNSISASFIAVTRDGKNWSYKGLPSGVPSGYETVYKNYSNTYYAINSNNFKFTTDTSFASGSWSTNFVNIFQNTTDTAGLYQSDVLRKDGTKWVSYGNVYSTNTGKYYPAKNISTDNGITFTTTFLNGLPSKQFNFAYSKSHVLALVYDDVANNGEYKAYISTDFLNFTLLNSNQFHPSMFRNDKYHE